MYDALDTFLSSSRSTFIEKCLLFQITFFIYLVILQNNDRITNCKEKAVPQRVYAFSKMSKILFSTNIGVVKDISAARKTYFYHRLRGEVPRELSRLVLLAVQARDVREELVKVHLVDRVPSEKVSLLMPLAEEGPVSLVRVVGVQRYVIVEVIHALLCTE